MTTKRRIIAGVLIALVAGMAIWWSASGSDEPRYKGKTVSEWLVAPAQSPRLLQPSQTTPAIRYITGRSADELEDYPQLRESLDSLGSNAVPVLLRHLRDGSSVRVRFYLRLAQSASLPHWLNDIVTRRLRPPFAIANRAATALQYLGTNAASAIPELERLASSDEHDLAWSQAFMTLAALKRDGWQAIERVLKSSSPANRSRLQSLAVGSGTRILKGGDLRLRSDVALILCHLDFTPFEVIPVLGDLIDTGEPSRALQALQSLEKLAADYITARDIIRRATRSENPEIRGLAQSILDRTGYTNTIAKQ